MTRLPVPVIVLSLAVTAAAAQAPAKPPTPTATPTATATATANPEEAPPAGAAPAEKRPEQELKEKGRLRGRDASEDQELKDLHEATKAYEEESRTFRKEIQLLIEKKYGQRRAELAASYEKAVANLEVEERKERLDAIAMFEEFLSRYPDDRAYSPDAMFRLAELYYERSKDDHMEAMTSYEERLKKLDAGELKDAGDQPKPDFSKSIALYTRLISDFPEYKLLDATFYLLAYCQELQEEFEVSRQTYLALIAKYPDSKFVPEAWVRMGEYWFERTDGDSTENLRNASDAYTKMLAFPDHPLFDKALYKLGWTFYRLDEYDSAVTQFVKLIDFYEQKRKESGDDEAFGDLRSEALQYTAISFTDDSWGGVPKAEAWFKAAGGRSWEPEVYRRIGDILYDIQKKDDRGYPTAVAAYKLFLSRSPYDKEAPQVQAKIIAALSRERLFDDETKEREALVSAFAEGTPWYEKNKDDPDVVAAAAELAEQALKVAAIFHHQQAQAFKKDGKLAEAFREFKAAARAYGDYLRRFPHTKDLYELTYYHAECLYNSTEFAASAREYEKVRDFEGETKYLQDAAYATVLSWQKSMERDIAEGRLEKCEAKTSKQRGDNAVISPRQLAQQHKIFIAAADVYESKVPPDPNTPAIMFKAGELHYCHDDFPEARRRFEDVVLKFPKDAVAQSAANLIIESYLIGRDWVNVQLAISKYLDRKDLDLDPELKKNLETFKLGAIYKQADKLMSERKFEDAAAEYLRLVAEKPDHEFADKALNNAAVCFENTERFDTAMKTYERIIGEYPKSTFADAALFRVAENARKSYDFDKAVARYEQLVKDYPTSKERSNALNNLAVLLVGLQRYEQGAKAYQRFAELYKDDPDAPKNQYKAAVVYERMEDWRKLIGALDAFIRKFGGDPKQNALVVQSQLKIAKANVALKNEKGAKAAYEACTREFDRRYATGVPEPGASQAAAECAFMLAEYEFDRWDRLKIEGNKKALEASFKRKKDMVKDLRDKYIAVVSYKNVDWTLAAFYRKAYLLERLSNAFFDAPIPPEVKRYGPEAEDLYRGKIAEAVVALEDQAVKDYQETLEQARKFGIANEWTRKTLESLNRYRPKEYPILKEARNRLQEEQLLPVGIATLPTGYAVPKVTDAPAPQPPRSAPQPPPPGPAAPIAPACRSDAECKGGFCKAGRCEAKPGSPGSDLGAAGAKPAPPAPAPAPAGPPGSGKVGK